MKKLFPILILAFLVHLESSAGEVREALPEGTTFSIKTDFWVYEIKGRRPYNKDNRYTMNSSRGGGLGDRKFKYRTTLPAGTQLEVVSLIKKSKREWIYLVRTKEYIDPKIGKETLSIFPLSMLKEAWGKRIKFAEQRTKTLRLDPDLFTDFRLSRSGII